MNQQNNVQKIQTQSNVYAITISNIQDYTWGINISQNKQTSMIKCQKETNVIECQRL